MNLTELNETFGIDQSVHFIEEQHTIVAELKNAYAKARVSLYGAQVLSFKPYDQDEVFFISEESYFEEGKAIRGGIPICWPWFGAHPENDQLPSHGFARISSWKVISSQTVDNVVTLKLGLSSSEESLKIWPYDFDAELSIRMEHDLSVTLTSYNKGDKPFEISAALHSYFKLTDFASTYLEGLKNTTFLDDVTDQEGLQKDELLKFTDRIDCRYRKTITPCVIHDDNRKIRVAKNGSQITVVWNPGKKLSSEMIDMGDDDYRHMLCVEAANSLEDSITVQPGKKHILETIISLF